MDEKELSLSLSLWCNNNGVFFWCRPDRSFVSSTERKKKGGGLFDFFFERERYFCLVGWRCVYSFLYNGTFFEEAYKKKCFLNERDPPQKPKPLDTKDRDKKPSERSRSVILLEAHQSSRMYTRNNTSHASFLLSFSTLFGRVFFFDTFSPTTLCFYSSY